MQQQPNHNETGNIHSTRRFGEKVAISFCVTHPREDCLCLFLFPDLINWSLVPSLESASKAQKNAACACAMDDRPTNSGFYSRKQHKNKLSKALKMLEEMVPPFFSAAYVISPLVKALICQETLYHVHGTMCTMSNWGRSVSFFIWWNQAIVIFTIFSF